MSEIGDIKQAIVLNMNKFLNGINQYAGKSSDEGLQLLIYTNFGSIECVLADPDVAKSNPISVVFSGSVELAGVSDPRAIHIKNAKIKHYGSKEVSQIVEDMILFTDQIVGLSFT